MEDNGELQLSMVGLDAPNVVGQLSNANQIAAAALNSKLVESAQTKLKELEEVRDKQDGRIQKLQATAFQLGSYYFVFQGVVLSAISNATTLTCGYKWYVITLSLLAAALNLVALTIISLKYIKAKASHDQTWSQCNEQENKISTLRRGEQYTGPAEDQTKQRNEEEKHREKIRCSVMGVCLFLFLAFTVVMVAGAWIITCNYDKRRTQVYGMQNNNNNSSNCLRICDGLKLAN